MLTAARKATIAKRFKWNAPSDAASEWNEFHKTFSNLLLSKRLGHVMNANFCHHQCLMDNFDDSDSDTDLDDKLHGVNDQADDQEDGEREEAVFVEEEPDRPEIPFIFGGRFRPLAHGTEFDLQSERVYNMYQRMFGDYVKERALVSQRKEKIEADGLQAQGFLMDCFDNSCNAYRDLDSARLLQFVRPPRPYALDTIWESKDRQDTRCRRMFAALCVVYKPLGELVCPALLKQWNELTDKLITFGEFSGQWTHLCQQLATHKREPIEADKKSRLLVAVTNPCLSAIRSSLAIGSITTKEFFVHCSSHIANTVGEDSGPKIAAKKVKVKASKARAASVDALDAPIVPISDDACFRCGRPGHFASNCKAKECSRCHANLGTAGHSARDCLEGHSGGAKGGKGRGGRGGGSNGRGGRGHGSRGGNGDRKGKDRKRGRRDQDEDEDRGGGAERSAGGGSRWGNTGEARGGDRRGGGGDLRNNRRNDEYDFPSSRDAARRVHSEPGYYGPNSSSSSRIRGDSEEAEDARGARGHEAGRGHYDDDDDDYPREGRSRRR